MKISIIIASYNYAKYIEQSIDSVINQTYNDWELIIVDDGSNDNSVEIIDSYRKKDSRIKFFQHENNENKGLQKTLLLGIQHATGDWIAFLESDDFLEPQYLEKKIEIINQYSDVSVIFNKVKLISENPDNKEKIIFFKQIQKKLSKMSFPKNMFYDFGIDNLILTFSCSMIKTNILKHADFNCPNNAQLDRWVWINIAQNTNFYYIDQELTNWRIHNESYIYKSKKERLHDIQIKAYKNVYTKNKSIKLLFYIYILIPCLLLVKIYRFIKNIL